MWCRVLVIQERLAYQALQEAAFRIMPEPLLESRRINLRLLPHDLKKTLQKFDTGQVQITQVPHIPELEGRGGVVQDQRDGLPDERTALFRRFGPAYQVSAFVWSSEQGVEPFRCQANKVCESLEQEFTVDAYRQARQERSYQGRQAGASIGTREVDLALEFFEQEFGQRFRGRHQRPKCLRPLLANQRVGIVAFRWQQELQFDGSAGMR